MGQRRPDSLPQVGVTMTMNSFVRRAIAAAALLALTACAGSQVRDYAQPGTRNLTIMTGDLDSGFFNPRDMNVGIYRDNGACNVEYMGHVWVENPSQTVALPTGQRVVLQLTFNSTSRLWNNSTQQEHFKEFIPRAGQRFQLEMSLDRDGPVYSMYQVSSRGKREVLLDPARPCPNAR